MNVQNDDNNSDKRLTLSALHDVSVEVSVVLGTATISLRDILELNRGSVVELNKKVGEYVDVYVNNTCIGQGEIVIVNDSIGVTLTKLYNNSIKGL